MNMKTIKRICLLLIFTVLSAMPMWADDFDTIYERMYERYLKCSTPSSEQIEEILNTILPNGAISGIDYKASNGSPRKHVQLLTELACAYQQPQNKYYKNEELRQAFLKSLRFWIITNHQAKNWWFRFIPYPNELSRSVVLMSEEIKKEQDLFDNTIEYLRWGYMNARPSLMTGANGADIIMGAFAASILTRNEAQMQEFNTKMTKLLTIEHRDGIQSDYLFSQHSGHGRQLYFTNYGKEFVKSTLSYMEFCKDTKFQTPAGVNLIQRLFTDGVQWIFFNKQYDPNNAGRFISSEKYSEEIQSLAERVYKLCPPTEQKAGQLAAKHISGNNELEGNRMFWRFDYMINRRKNYMATTRMTSTRTVGNEAGNGEGNFNYYSSNGVNYIFVEGNEYNGNFFKVFNNRQYPGITSEQDTKPLPIPVWGEGGGNASAFAGGASDSIYGTCAMNLDRRGLQANKAWFYFDREFVALGCGIRCNQGTGNVFTTINQCNRHGEVLYCIDNEVLSLNEQKITVSPQWIYHNKIAYLNLDEYASIHVENSPESTISINIDHGVQPKNGKYAYIVYPDIESTSDIMKYAENIPITVLSNNENVQAVRHNSLKITQIIFYRPGTLRLNNGVEIVTDSPCAIVWNESKRRIHISNPMCESVPTKKIHIRLHGANTDFESDIILPQGDKAGSSVMIKLF